MHTHSAVLGMSHAKHRPHRIPSQGMYSSSALLDSTTTKSAVRTRIVAKVDDLRIAARFEADSSVRFRKTQVVARIIKIHTPLMPTENATCTGTSTRLGPIPFTCTKTTCRRDGIPRRADPAAMLGGSIGITVDDVCAT